LPAAGGHVAARRSDTSWGVVLRAVSPNGDARRVDDDALRPIMISMLYAHTKLDRIIDLLEEDGEEEEDEADG
jgi:hypothetical protein